MDERTERIILAAMDLAERDGYDAVRLRDVAGQAEVALGTVYRRFSCKEDILAAVLNLHVSALRETITSSPSLGGDVETRLSVFWEQITLLLAERPKLAAAMLRTVACGVPDLVERVARFRGDMTEVILCVMRGGAPNGGDLDTEDEEFLAAVLQDVLFAALVGWTGGLHDTTHVISHLRKATHLLIQGAQRR